MEAVRQGGGAYVRGLGENAVTFSIVSHVYRLDRLHHGSWVTLRDASQFGIDENQLARLVEVLASSGIFDTDDFHTVSLTEHGRNWYEQTIRDNEKPSGPDDKSAGDADENNDALPPPTTAEINVDEVSYHLAFMTNNDLRGYVLDDLREINATFAARAKAAGVPYVCPHALTGTAATLLAETGAAAEVIADHLSPEETSTTKKHYVAPGAAEAAQLEAGLRGDRGWEALMRSSDYVSDCGRSDRLSTGGSSQNRTENLTRMKRLL